MKTIRVNLEMAKRLANLGYLEECSKIYVNNIPLLRDIKILKDITANVDRKKCFLAPTLDEAIDWLLKEQSIDICVVRNKHVKWIRYDYQIYTDQSNPKQFIKSPFYYSDKDYAKGEAIIGATNSYNISIHP